MASRFQYDRSPSSEPERPGGKFFTSFRQTVESLFNTLKGQLDLERHGGHTTTKVLVRILKRAGGRPATGGPTEMHCEATGAS